MTVTMLYLATLLSQWRLALPANGDNKANYSKAIMAPVCAAELSNWSKGVEGFN